jgi:phosphate transport system protein
MKKHYHCLKGFSKKRRGLTMNRPKLAMNLRKLDDDLMIMSILVEEQLSTVKAALIRRDLKLAKQAIDMDARIDGLESLIEKECLDAIALQQPLAGDLRRIESILKMITDLERIGDNSVNIAKVILTLDQQPLVKPLIDLPKMFDLVLLMLQQYTDSYVRSSVELAVLTAKADDEVDALYENIYRELLEILVLDQTQQDQIVSLLFIGRYLERMGDHITNLCERVIYMATGERMSF